MTPCCMNVRFTLTTLVPRNTMAMIVRIVWPVFTEVHPAESSSGKDVLAFADIIAHKWCQETM